MTVLESPEIVCRDCRDVKPFEAFTDDGMMIRLCIDCESEQADMAVNVLLGQGKE